jgi:hypothetical protein
MLGPECLLEFSGYRLYCKADTHEIANTLKLMEQPQEKQVRDDPPPFLKTWDRVYVAVLVYLASLIAALYLITLMFEPPR